MDRLILLRHGKAEPDSASGDDFDRRLASRGAKESAAMGAHLADMGFAPDVVLVSTAARTRDTWEAVSVAFPKAEVRFEDDLYHADSVAVRRMAEAALKESGTVMVVGHNPGLQELTIALLREGSAPGGLISKAMHRFPTATAAVFLIDPNGRPHYDGLFYPERHD